MHQVQILSQNSIEHQKKKRSSSKTEGILFPKSSEDQKINQNRSPPKFGTIFRRNLEVIRADTRFFVQSR